MRRIQQTRPVRKVNPILYEMVAYAKERSARIPEEWKDRLKYDPMEDVYVDFGHENLSVYDEVEEFLEVVEEKEEDAVMEESKEEEDLRECVECGKETKWGEYQHCHQCGRESCNECLGEEWVTCKVCK